MGGEERDGELLRQTSGGRGKERDGQGGKEIDEEIFDTDKWRKREGKG